MRYVSFPLGDSNRIAGILINCGIAAFCGCGTPIPRQPERTDSPTFQGLELPEIEVIEPAEAEVVEPLEAPMTPPPSNEAITIEPPAPSPPPAPENERPIAVARFVETFGSDPFQVILDGADSYDPDGRIVAWHWFFAEQEFSSDPTVFWLGAPFGATVVTLNVTDNSGGAGSTVVTIIRRGFRPGRWEGSTAQGFSLTFTVTESDPVGDLGQLAYHEQYVTDQRFEYEFTGLRCNPLFIPPTGTFITDCSYREAVEPGDIFSASVENCAASVTDALEFSHETHYSFSATCDSLVIDEILATHATGTLHFELNCQFGNYCFGSTSSIGWQADWIGE